MLRFASDYQEGAHPRVLQKLAETNLEQTAGYGEDEYCLRAAELLRERCMAPHAAVHFLVGGTQTNMTFLSAALRPHQGAICADTGHIAVHETGAVEATGHKVIAVSGAEGKLSAEAVDAVCRRHFSDDSHEHMVMPKVVYVSDSTELGTIYTKAELSQLRAACDRWNLYLYLDGARLGYALCAQGNDVDLPFLASVCDAFYIGGTKQGLLFGEALVLQNSALQQDFRYILKQKGGMLAKGRLLGVQFEEMFRDDLYFELSRHAVEQAMRLKAAFARMGFSFLSDSPSNQQFPILPDSLLERLRKDFAFSDQGRVDATHTAVRFCTSWATRPEDVDALIGALEQSPLAF